MKIVIIDSGIDISKKYFDTFAISGFGIYVKEDDKIEITHEFNDENGHGTAVANIITRMVPSAEFIICKIYFGDAETSEKSLIAALNYVCDEIDCDIINISSGIIQGEHIELLKMACERLEQKNVILVSAFDNSGAISYPAAFDNVIGVCASKKCKNNFDFIYVDETTINVYAKGTSQNLLWTNPNNMLVSGSSFSAPYVTSFIARLLEEKKVSFRDALEEIRKKSIDTIHSSKCDYNNKFHSIDIKKAVVFPFNKETHTLFRFEDQLNFEISHIYNFKYLGNIGRTVGELLHVDTLKSHVIESISKIDWTDSFDTFILGHCKDVNNSIGFDIKTNIIKKCVEYHKNLYTFDSDFIDDEILDLFEDNGLSVYCPEITPHDIPKALMGKLFISSTPIVSVLGTSSKQGKFSLQLILKKLFSYNGYKVGQLGTEPTSKLFGADEVYTIGYNSTVYISGGDSIATINSLIHNIELKAPDIIISGSQSNTIPRQIRNLDDIPYNGYEFLIGVNPDCVILCVDYDDDNDFIKRTVNYIEGLSQSCVIGLVIFPLRKRITWSGLYMDNDLIDERDLFVRKRTLKEELGIPAYINGVDEDMKRLFDNCLDFFVN